MCYAFTSKERKGPDFISDMHVQNKKYSEELINGAFGTLARLPQQPKNYKISTILVYGHVDILWTYQEAKIQFWLFDDCVVLRLSEPLWGIPFTVADPGGGGGQAVFLICRHVVNSDDKLSP